MNSENASEFDMKLLEQKFSQAWSDQQNPDINDYISGLTSKQQEQALEVLIPLDIQHRMRLGDNVSEKSYAFLGDPALEIARRWFAEKLLETPAGELATLEGNHEPQRIGAKPISFSSIDPDDFEPGRLITERYKLINKIGQGGMGTVWLAQQEKPMRRRVAIKIIGRALDSKEALARFSAERQALAMMNHANIAKVLDAGVTEDGRPFFAMEWVKGVPITNYCNESRLTIENRLELMAKVCDAVQHAHQKGIIHRDLKPSNILVTLEENKPVPKVIDFGLAKALDHAAKLTDETLVTQIGNVVGTLQYMSPEQANSSELDVDTRTDVYSLGVILYQLLTDIIPLEKNTLTGKSILQIVLMIKQLEIIRPSKRLTSDNDTLILACAQRQTSSRELINKLEGELDWIVLKSLHRDRLERYPAASALGDDMRRFLNDEAVEARPPSTAYKLKKFMRNNRGLVAAGGSFIGLLTVSLIAISFFWQIANLAKVEAENERDEANRLRLIAEKKENEARRTKDLILQPLRESSFLLGGSRGMSATDLLVTVLNQLEESDSGGESISNEDPSFAATIQYEIGVTLRDNGEHETAVSALSNAINIRRQILEPDDPLLLDTIVAKQSAILESLKVQIASTATFGNDEKVDLVEKFDSALGKFESDSRQIPDSENQLGQAYLFTFKELKKIGIERPEYIKKAIQNLKTNWNAAQIKYGPNSTEANTLAFGLANAYLKEGSEKNIEKSIEMNRRLIEEWKENRVRGAYAINNLAESYHAKAKLTNDTGLYDQAIEEFKKSLEIKTKHLPENHTSRFNTIRNMILCLCDASRFDQASKEFDDIRKGFVDSETLREHEISNALDQMDALESKLNVKFNLDENWHPSEPSYP